MSSDRDADEANAATLSAGGASGPASVVLAAPEARLRDYELGEVIAEGGMGRIYAARDLRLDRPVAIKELLVQSEAARLRFAREIRISARLQHPSIIHVLEAGQRPTGEPFYAMKLVAGRPLSELIRGKGSLGERLGLLPHLTAASDALAYAHRQRVIHRDLKPHNVLVGDFGETVVIDWGLAKVLGEVDEDVAAGPYRSPAGDQVRTVFGAVMGTPAYMPPEQARGEVADERADVYALGAMLYELLTGRPPFVGKSSKEVLDALLAEAPPRLSQIAPDLPPDLLTIVDKAMARRREDRYPSAAPLAEDLRRFQTGQLVQAHAYSTGELLRRWLRRHRAAVTVASILLGVLVAGAAVSVRNIVRAEAVAQEQRLAAESRSRQLMLQEARALLGRDPTRALAALRPFLRQGGDPRQARLVAGEAWNRGVARRILRGHASNVTQSAFLPDGRTVSTSWDGTMRLWEPDGSGRDLGKPGQNVGWLAAARDGRSVITRDWQGTYWVWSLPALSVRGIEGNPAANVDTVISPDSRWLAGQGKDKRIWLWPLHDGEAQPLGEPMSDATTIVFAAGGELFVGSREGIDVWRGTERRRLNGVPVVALEPSPDASLVAALGPDDVVRVWRVADGALVHELRGHGGHFDPRLVFTADGRYLVSLAQTERFAGGELWAWDLQTGSGTLLVKGREQVTYAVAFPRGHRVAVSDSSGGIVVWDVEERSARRLVGHDYFVFSLALSADGRTLASSSVDRTVRVWDVEDGAPTVRPTRMDHDRNSLGELSPAADRLFFVRGDAKLVALGVDDGDERVLGESPARIDALALAPDGRRVATGGIDGGLSIWEGRERRTFGEGKPVTQLAWDGAGLVVGRDDGGVAIWDVEKRTATQLAAGDRRITALALSARWLAAGDAGGTVWLWSRSGGPARRLPGEGSVKALVFSPDGRLLASGARGRAEIHLWATESGTAPQVLRGHAWQVWTLAFSPDGSLLASGGSDHTIRLWRVEDGASIRVLSGHGNLVTSLAFSPDGARLASSSGDQTARLWDVASGSGRLLQHQSAPWRVVFASDGRELVSWGAADLRRWSDALPLDAKGLLTWIDGRTSSD